MKIISLCTQKGGSGKSTLCASLAVAAQEAGHQVASRLMMASSLSACVGATSGGLPCRAFAHCVRETSRGLEVLGRLADTVIVLRNDHQDAIGHGQGVTEFNPEGAAADEIRRLWLWISNRTKDLANVEAA
jgi:cellulose biosynthesis protein BcsQ